jgi:hypothetical protein
VWYVDRYAPAAFESFEFNGEMVLRIAIDGVNDGADNRGAESDTFFNTQGRKFDLPLGTYALSGELYFPADWAGVDSRRRSDLWATAVDSSNAISFYPIAGIVNTDGTPVIRYWDSNSGWINTTITPAADSWYKFGLLLEGADLVIYVNDSEVGRLDSNESVALQNVILQAYNFNDPSLGDEEQSSDSYDAYWDNISYQYPEVRNLTQDTLHLTIGDAVANASAEDIISLAGGTYNEPPVSINKVVTILGPNAGLAGDDPARGPEARIANSKLTITAAAVIDGVEIYQTNDTADAVLVQAAATVRNSVIRREGVNTGTIARGITTASGTGGYVFENNLFTGDPTGGFFGGHTTWNSGLWLNGGSGTISGNTFENCRTAINADDFNAGITISGNSFSTCGTYLAFGGVTPTDGQFTIAGNEFFLDWVDPVTNWLPSAMFNNSNVAATFRLDVTGNTFGGVASADLTDEQKFAIEARNYHRGRSARNGVVDFVVGEQVVMPGTTILSAIDAAAAGDTVRVGPGTYAEAVLLDKALTLQGAGSGVSILDGSGLTAGGLVRIQGLTADAVTVDGFTLQNAPLSGNNRFAVAISGCADPAEVTVTNNHIIGRGGPETGVYDWGVVAQNSSATIVINNNTLDDVMNNAILIERATGNVEIGHNTINVPDYDASNAIFSMSYKSGTDLGNVTGLHRYHGNTISSDNPTYGIFGGITVASAYGVSYGERSDGVYSNLVIENNVISDITPWYTSGKGIQLEIDGPDGGFPGVQIRNNTITALQASIDPAHKSRGIRLLGPVVDPDITGNTLTDLYYGINIRGTFSEALYPSGVEIRNNKLLNNVFGVYNESTLDSDAAENYWGAADGPSHTTNPSGTGSAVTDNVTFSPWYADEAMTLLVTAANFENTEVAEGDTVTEGDLYIGGTYTVEGTLDVTGILTLGESGVLDVVNGELVLNGSTIAGSFTFFNSFGSVNFNDDVSITGSAEGLILISDVHVADGATITVDGTLVIDGSTVDSDGHFNLVVAQTGDFTMARTVMVNGDMVVNSGAVKVYDNRFETSTINVMALATGAAIYHNITDNLAWLTDDGTDTVTAVDGWGNLDGTGSTQNNLLLELDISALAADRTQDGDGNVYIQPLDAIRGTIDVSALQAKIAGVEMLLGYSTDYLAATTLGEGPDWQLVPPVGYDSATVIGKIDAALGVDFDFVDPEGTNADQTVADIELIATNLEGQTVFFQRVKLASDTFAGDTRLSTGGPSPAYLTPFTANSGTITIDGTQPVINTDPLNIQVLQDGIDMTLTGAITIQGNLDITAAAYDALAGIDDTDVVVQLVGPDTYEATLDATSLVNIGGVDYTAYAFVYEVVPATLNGDYNVVMTVTDRSGNQTVETLGAIEINKNQVSVDVVLEGLVAGPLTRDVVFVFTDALGSVLETRTVAVEFTGGSGTVVFADVDGNSVNLSAKTAWNLRERLPIGLDGNGQAAVSFVLPGGDLNNDNAVNMLDYSILRYYWNTPDDTADITANGVVDLADFGILQANFYLMGDPQ